MRYSSGVPGISHLALLPLVRASLRVSPQRQDVLDAGRTRLSKRTTRQSHIGVRQERTSRERGLVVLCTSLSACLIFSSLRFVHVRCISTSCTQQPRAMSIIEQCRVTITTNGHVAPTCPRYFCATEAICSVRSAVLPPCPSDARRLPLISLSLQPCRPDATDNITAVSYLTAPHVTSMKRGSRLAMRSMRMYLIHHQRSQHSLRHDASEANACASQVLDARGRLWREELEGAEGLLLLHRLHARTHVVFNEALAARIAGPTRRSTSVILSMIFILYNAPLRRASAICP